VQEAERPRVFLVAVVRVMTEIGQVAVGRDVQSDEGSSM